MLAAVFVPTVAHGQAAESDRGTISGTIRLMTPGAILEPATVSLIMRRGSDGELESTEQTANDDGSFAFEVEADPEISYFAVVTYGGVPYFSRELLVSPELPTISVDFDVYATVATAPELAIDRTVVTLLAINREDAELTFVREDLVRQDEPVVFVGADDGVTLRLPVPDGTIEAGGFDDAAGEYELDGQLVTVSTPIGPGVTSIVTRYTVRYEPSEDEYRLRITSPLPAEQIAIRIPERFLRAVEPQGDTAARGEDDEFEGEPLIVIERTEPARAGQGVVADLIGLSGVERASHPLTSGAGAAIGALVALIVVAGLAFALRGRAEAGP